MATFVVLVRALNVGGTGKLPMKELKTMCEKAGFESVRTYIASGNVIFETTDSRDRARSAIEKRLEDYTGTKVDVLIRTARETADLVAASPYPDEPGNRVAVMFLDQKPPADLGSRARGVADERFEAAVMEVFTHYPEGMGRSKLSFDLGVATTRNMNTVKKLAEMAAGG